MHLFSNFDKMYSHLDPYHRLRILPTRRSNLNFFEKAISVQSLFLSLTHKKSLLLQEATEIFVTSRGNIYEIICSTSNGKIDKEASVY